MKILFFHRWVGVHLGGTETHVRDLVEQFSLRGHKVAVLTRAGNENPSLNPRVLIYRIPKNFRESEHSYETLLPLYLHTAVYMAKSFLYLLYLRLVKREIFDVISVHF